MNLINKYRNEIIPKLKEELSLKNDLAVPTVEKIVINVGASEALTSREVLEMIKQQIAAVAGQRPKETLAKKSISTFKLRKNDPIGVMVTLRGIRAWNFLEKFIAIVIPRMRDFRGLSLSKFDEFGNYSLGLNEQILFPEVDYSKIDKVRGLVVTIVIKRGDKQKSKKLLELLGVPFKTN